MHTKKCTTKKGWTKNQPVTTYHAFGNVVFPRVSQNLPDQPFGEGLIGKDSVKRVETRHYRTQG